MVVSFDKLPKSCAFPFDRKKTSRFLEAIAPDLVPRIRRVHYGRNRTTRQEARIVGRGAYWEIRINFWLEHSRSRVLTRKRGWIKTVRSCGGVVSRDSDFVRWPEDSALRYTAFLLAHEVAHPTFWLLQGKQMLQWGGGREEEMWCDRWALKAVERSFDALLVE